MDLGVELKSLGLTNWNMKYLSQAEFISSWSKDPSDKVGCVISDQFNTPLGQGFNGFPRGTIETPDMLLDKEIKRLRMVHAEDNAISFSTKDLTNSVFHVTRRVCATCAGKMIQHKVGKVICLYDDSGTFPELSSFWDKSIKEAKAMFTEVGVTYVAVPRTLYLAWLAQFNKRL